jgi:hypothetical protein
MIAVAVAVTAMAISVYSRKIYRIIGNIFLDETTDNDESAHIHAQVQVLWCILGAHALVLVG